MGWQVQVLEFCLLVSSDFENKLKEGIVAYAMGVQCQKIKITLCYVQYGEYVQYETLIHFL